MITKSLINSHGIIKKMITKSLINSHGIKNEYFSYKEQEADYK